MCLNFGDFFKNYFNNLHVNCVKRTQFVPVNAVKSNTAYYLLLLYVTVIIKPILPIVHDWCEHTFNEVNHLSHVHQYYGNNHTEQEIAKSSKDNSSNHSSNNLKSEDQVPFHISQVISYKNFSFNELDFRHKLFKVRKLPAIVIQIPGPPPKFS